MNIYLVIAHEVDGDGTTDRWVDSAWSSYETASQVMTRRIAQWGDIVSERARAGVYRGEAIAYSLEGHPLDRELD